MCWLCVTLDTLGILTTSGVTLCHMKSEHAAGLLFSTLSANSTVALISYCNISDP